jgi:hypothetical protein
VLSARGALVWPKRATGIPTSDTLPPTTVARGRGWTSPSSEDVPSPSAAAPAPAANVAVREPAAAPLSAYHWADRTGTCGRCVGGCCNDGGWGSTAECSPTSRSSNRTRSPRDGWAVTAAPFPSLVVRCSRSRALVVGGTTATEWGCSDSSSSDSLEDEATAALASPRLRARLSLASVAARLGNFRSLGAANAADGGPLRATEDEKLTTRSLEEPVCVRWQDELRAHRACKEKSCVWVRAKQDNNNNRVQERNSMPTIKQERQKYRNKCSLWQHNRAFALHSSPPYDDVRVCMCVCGGGGGGGPRDCGGH